MFGVHPLMHITFVGILMLAVAGCGKSQNVKYSVSSQHALQKELKIKKAETFADSALGNVRELSEKQIELSKRDARIQIPDDDSVPAYTEQSPLVASLQSLNADAQDLLDKINQGPAPLRDYYTSGDSLSYYPEDEDILLINEIGRSLKIIQGEIIRYKMGFRLKNRNDSQDAIAVVDAARSIVSCESKGNGKFIFHVKGQWQSGSDNEKYSQWLQLGMKNYWDDENLTFSLDKTEKAGIKLTKAKGLVSYTHGNGSNEILIGDGGQYSNEYYAKILAHELGHIFGFKDCYFQSYDLQKDTLIYFERDPHNLMCSLRNGATIPATYREKLRDFFCL